MKKQLYRLALLFTACLICVAEYGGWVRSSVATRARHSRSIPENKPLEITVSKNAASFPGSQLKLAAKPKILVGIR